MTPQKVKKALDELDYNSQQAIKNPQKQAEFLDEYMYSNIFSYPEMEELYKAYDYKYSLELHGLQHYALGLVREEPKMIDYTKRLDNAMRKAAWAHEQAGQHRKGSDIPYIIHPAGVMVIAGSVTNDEDTLIACLLHDILEDVDDTIYSEADMLRDFGENVVKIVKDVTKDETATDWHARSKAYLDHLENKACEEAVIVSASDKIHNLLSILSDYDMVGDDIWRRFTTKSSEDQLWWYCSILDVIKKRNAPSGLIDKLNELVETLRMQLGK